MFMNSQFCIFFTINLIIILFIQPINCFQPIFHPSIKHYSNILLNKQLLKSNKQLQSINSNSNINSNEIILSQTLNNNNIKKKKYFYFTGAGVYFWWQAGAAKYIQQNCDITSYSFIGASAGSLTSLLLLCNIDFDQSATIALNIANRYKLYERKTGKF